MHTLKTQQLQPSVRPVPNVPQRRLLHVFTTKQRQKYKKYRILGGKKGTGREAINHSHKINFIVLLTLLCFRPAAG